MTGAWLIAFVAGIALGIVLMIPVARLLSARAEKRSLDAERRARAAERLAELGSLTGGLAHEIKNPLSTVGLNAQLLAEEIAESDLAESQRERLIRRVESLGREANRLRDILTDFLRFAGRVKLDPQPRDVGQILEELSDFFHPQCDQAGVLLRVDRPPAAVLARVDEGLLKQAILNLMINAVQAMSLRNDRTAKSELILRLEENPREVRLHVIDTGPGIAADRLESIFHPYVSDKPGGTGLGLPTARRIVEEHGGRIVVHSAPGKGSDFTIHLPR